jgi:nucleoside phosphorylase
MTEPIDVLIVTALKDELDAVLRAPSAPGDTNGGSSSASRGEADAWRQQQDPLGYKYHVRTFLHESGVPFSVAAARTSDMGETATAVAAMRLVYHLRPRYLAMCGICAGARGEVELGDVIVAERLYKFDAGAVRSKRTAGTAKKAARYVVRVAHDLRTYNLDPILRQQAEDFGSGWSAGLPPRPLTYEQQEWALLGRLLAKDGSMPTPTRADRAAHFPDWPMVIERLRQKGLLGRGLRLTELGRERAEEERLRFPEGRTSPPPRVHVGAVATSARLQRDDRLFPRLRRLVRKTIGAEMEGAAIGAVAELEIIDAIMVKGVTDFGDGAKNDQFRAYAASVAASFLLAFFRRHLSIQPAERPSPPAARRTSNRAPPLDGVAPAYEWLLLLKVRRQGASTDLAPAELQAQLVSATKDEGLVVEATGEPLLFRVRSSEETFETFRDDLVAQRDQGGLRKAIQYVCRGTGEDADDPNEGKFGRSPRRGERLLWANVRNAGKDWYAIELSVQSVNPAKPLKDGVVAFRLHPSFASGRKLEVPIVNGRASMTLGAWGSFTVGAEVRERGAKRATELELDLGNVPGVPRGFIDR